MDISVDKNNTREISKSNFEHGFRPLYYFSRLAGLWPFTIIHHSNETNLRARFDYFDGLWFVLTVCLYLALAFISYENLTSIQNQNEVFIARFVLYAFRITCFMFGVLGIVLDTINRNKLINILQKFIVFDKTVGFMVYLQVSLSFVWT